MKTRDFYVLYFGLSVALLGLSLILSLMWPGPVDGQSLAAYNLFHTARFLGLFAGHVAGGLVLFALMFCLTAAAHGVVGLDSLREKFELPNNDSHAFLFGAMLAGSLALSAWTPMLNPIEFMLNLLYRGVLVWIIAVLLTTVFAYLLNVRSLSEFERWLEEPNNNSHVVALSCGLFGLMLLASQI